MNKFFSQWVILLLLLNSRPLWAKSTISKAQISSMATGVKSDLEKAQRCMPEIRTNEVIFCAGAQMPLKIVLDVDKNGVNFCESLINKNGYKLIREGQESGVDKTLWDSFYQSTQRSLRPFMDLRLSS